jgi:hypothetical protein
LAKKLPLLPQSRSRALSNQYKEKTPTRIKGQRPLVRNKAVIADIRNILVIGDLHVGSIYGVLPPDFVSSDGAEKPQNAAQKYLWDCW